MAEILLEREMVAVPKLDIEHLVTEDDTPVDNIFSEKQQRLLTETLYTSWPGPPGEERSFIALANVGLFYSVHKPPLVPDVLVSLDVQLPDDLWEKHHRSYFQWEYGKPPDVVIEIVSNRKGREDARKLDRYARLGIAYYIIYDPNQQLSQDQLRVYELRRRAYVPMRQFWLPELGLGLMLWEGVYEGKEEIWLRWHDEDGQLILTGAEMSARERQQAKQEYQRAERLAAQLRKLGIEPE